MALVYDNPTIEYFMKESYDEALKSPDPSSQNGAILLNIEGEIARGCNDFPKGVSSIYWDGPKDGKYARVCHAEVSAILDAARQAISTEGAYLICSWAACSNCSKYIARAGISRLYRHPYGANTNGTAWTDDCRIGDEIMQQAGVEIIELPPLSDWEGTLRRNGEAWRPGG